MSATVSLSKGVFAFKNGKSKSRKEIFLSEFWRQEYGRNNPLIQEITLKNYHKCWNAISNLIEESLDNTYSNVLRDLIDYVKRTGYERCQNTNENLFSANKDIPTACLVTGVNMPDHSTLFDSLSKCLSDEVSPHIARLSPRECSNIKMTVYHLVSSIVNGDCDTREESDSDDEVIVNPKTLGNKKLKRAQCTMSVLSSWFLHNQEANDLFNGSDSSPFTSPSKKRKPSFKSIQNTKNRYSPHKEKDKVLKEDRSSENNGNVDAKMMKPLIVIIENVEAISIQVLQDFIHIASEHMKEIPFVFVFGVSTSPSYIHRHLSQEASSFIAMEIFQSQPSSLLLSEIIEKVLMSSDIPCHMGGKVFKLLLDLFLYHDLSVKNFISSLKFCVLEHFTRGVASFLCCSTEERESVLHHSSSSCLVAAIRSLPSYSKLLEHLTDGERDCYNNDMYLKEQVKIQLDELEQWYVVFCRLVRALHCLTHSLPGFPLGRQVREVFSLCLSGQVSDTEEFQNAWKILSMSSVEELLLKTGEVVKILEDKKKNPELVELKEKLSNFLERAKHIDNEKRSEVETQVEPRVIELKPSDRFHLREKLLGGMPKSKMLKHPHEELRMDLLSFYENIFISHLKPFQTKPFHEVFFFDSLGSVKYQLLGSLRATISTGLINPQKYLQCECCKLEDANNLTPSLPDLSLCYKLHLECGRLINLCDWLEAFISLVSSDDETVEQKKVAKTNKKKSVNEVLQARFIQSVSELQFLGYIKPTKRKTDHVQRLTWGGC